MACFCCFRCRYDGSGTNSGHVRLEELPTVKLDTSRMGSEVVVVKNGRRICGTGAALANVPIVQNKAYFEVKLQCTGIWGVGVATEHCDMNTIPLGENTDSWVLRHTAALYHRGEEKGTISEMPQEGDVIGVSYDHVDLNFFVNGHPMNSPISGIKGTVYPVFYVDDSAILDVHFKRFYHQPPEGFEEIMIEQSLL
ncbi:hypothetical protein NP493_743g03025 [Ridgeia piscesae]|uniref:SPRY domain-containing protein 7 n=1 Tax=Ridgeia piscesae TaxID=27915 RepID=A0AAD9KPQ0_RIDPI|nr:hypothetical protein NP493_743g03025 [Ridgeia piscesae]